jgi:hypothetical protein
VGERRYQDNLGFRGPAPQGRASAGQAWCGKESCVIQQVIIDMEGLLFPGTRPLTEHLQARRVCDKDED